VPQVRIGNGLEGKAIRSHLQHLLSLPLLRWNWGKDNNGSALGCCDCGCNLAESARRWGRVKLTRMTLCRCDNEQHAQLQNCIVLAITLSHSMFHILQLNRVHYWDWWPYRIICPISRFGDSCSVTLSTKNWL